MENMPQQIVNTKGIESSSPTLKRKSTNLSASSVAPSCRPLCCYSSVPSAHVLQSPSSDLDSQVGSNQLSTTIITQPSASSKTSYQQFRHKSGRGRPPLSDITNVASTFDKKSSKLQHPFKDFVQINSARWRGLQNLQLDRPKRTRNRIKQSEHIGFHEPLQNNLTQDTQILSIPQSVITSDTHYLGDRNSSTALPPQHSYYHDIEFQYRPDQNGDGEEDVTDELMDEAAPEHISSDDTCFISLEAYIDEGDPTFECKFCGALLWFNERSKKDSTHKAAHTFSLCCLKGKVVLPLMKPPPALLYSLFFQKNLLESRNFHDNIRQYNNMFSFTSMGGKIDHSKNSGGAPYSFVLSGVNYHNIGSLCPSSGERPVYSQLYVHDTENEVSNRISAVSKFQTKCSIDPSIVDMIKCQLDQVNPYVQQFRHASSMISCVKQSPVKLCLISSRNGDGRNYNIPTASEVAALIVGDIDMNFNVRDIIVEEHSGSTQRINELHPSYLPLQYPLLFPFGEDGYRDDVPHREETLGVTKVKKMVSMREFFSFRLMTRKNEISSILHSSRLFQQFIVDAFTMMESQRLLWVRTHQKELRVDLYQGIADAVLRGERNASSIGKRIVLPSSFVGGARYMIQNYQDAMAICRAMGYPDLFLTFTCNPAWPEIQRYCALHSLKSTNKPEILSRIFKLKLDCLMKTLKDKCIFGTIQADIYTIEFQKRGLPHAHILLWLDQSCKISDSSSIDKYISAELPNHTSSPLLHELVRKFMIHGPCGHVKPNAACMKGRKCSKKFPRPFNPHTTIDDDGFPTYRRRDDGRIIQVKGVPLDNRYVVPYNPPLLLMFHAHINVERCNQSTAIKYLFKYISKGNDRVVAAIFDSQKDQCGNVDVDEIRQYYNCRYVSSCEGAWRIFGFNIHQRHPSVERLSFHLPNEQLIIYANTDDVEELLDKPRVCESQFLAWFHTNKHDKFARTLTYIEFPTHYVYDRSDRIWRSRKRGRSLGRITHVSPSSGELYFLRVLLTKVKGPTCYDDLKTFDGVVHKTFRDACFARGLLDDDAEYIAALKDASLWATGNTLRKLFVTMLLCSSLQQPVNVWMHTKQLLSEDLFYVNRFDSISSNFTVSQAQREDASLIEIQSLLQLNGKCLQDFPCMPLPVSTTPIDMSNHLIMQELNYDRLALRAESDKLIRSLNDEQRHIYDTVMSILASSASGFYFVYGYGGTGKTFLWNTLISSIRASGEIVLAVASSGIAATLLPSGRTAHSRFAIPIHISESSVCSIRQNSPLAKLLIQTKLIIWDEAPMVQRFCVEAFDRSLRDIMHCDRPFGGKCIIMGGDFRQILPVIPKGSRGAIVDACINSSHLWDHCTIFSLTRNMRLSTLSSSCDNAKLRWFSQWLLDVGDGKIGQQLDGISEIEIPTELLISDGDDPIRSIVESTYPNLLHNLQNNEYFTDRAILAPTLDMVNQINDYMCALLPGHGQEYSSCDTICRSSEEMERFDDLYNTEFLNTINCSGLAPHKLVLKVGTPIMLLRNIDQACGLCNGTRLRITQLAKNVIGAVTLNGSHPNENVLIPRMNMNPSENRWPFRMQRRQFPISISFSMTINKSQGQSLKHVGIYLSKPVFTHGQLYVALSRVKSMDGLKIVVSNEDNAPKNKTINVVYREIFRNVIA